MQKINFAEEFFVSPTEKREQIKIQLFAVFFLLVGIAAAVGSLFADKTTSNKLQVLINQQNQIVSQLDSRANKQKEIVFYLTKKRLEKIAQLKKQKKDKNPYLLIIKDKIAKSVDKITSFNLNGNRCEMTFEIDNYDKFISFTEKLDEMSIVKENFEVKETKFNDQNYKISVAFSFGI